MPPAPFDVRASENGSQSLKVSWSFVRFIEGVVVTFTLTVSNLQLNDSEPLVIGGIQEQYYFFTALSSTSCDTYSFQVTALNVAGVSNSSEVITRSLPSLPDISAVEVSLSHSLMVSGKGVQLTISFQVK